MKSRVVQNLAVPVLVFFNFHEVCEAQAASPSLAHQAQAMLRRLEHAPDESPIRGLDYGVNLIFSAATTISPTTNLF